MSKAFNLTLAAGFLSAATLLTPVAFAQPTTLGGDDAETRAVQEAINKDAELRTAQVHVQTVDGVVYLHGVVTSEDAVDRAGAIAIGVPGVGNVVNALGDNQS